MLSRSEQGFTIIELAVGLVLLAVLMAGAVYGVVQMTTGKDVMGSNQKAQRQAIDAIEMIRKDVGAARSPAMFRWNGTRDDLRDIAYHFVDGAKHEQARNECGGVTNAAFINCLRGIVQATPTELWVRAEALPNSASSECVGYVVAGNALRRFVNPDWRRCGPSLKTNANTTETRLVVASGLTAQPFRYTLRYNATAAGAPAFARFQVANVANCRTFTHPQSRALLNAAAARTNWIVGVEVDFTGIARDGDGGALTQLRSSIPVSAHVGGEHAYAVGCSY